MLSCEDILKELNDLLDDPTAAEARHELREHLEHCRPCEVVVNSCRKTIKIVTASRSFDLPGDLSSKIIARLRAAGCGQKNEGGEEA